MITNRKDNLTDVIQASPTKPSSVPSTDSPSKPGPQQVVDNTGQVVTLGK